jgi:hypothetical protein
MPWTPNDASSHTSEADDPKSQEQWAEVANKELASGKTDGEAVMIANGVVKKRKAKNVGKSFRELARLAKSDVVPYILVHSGSCLEAIARSMEGIDDEDEEKAIGTELAPSKPVTVRQHTRVNVAKQQKTAVRPFQKRKFDV